MVNGLTNRQENGLSAKEAPPLFEEIIQLTNHGNSTNGVRDKPQSDALAEPILAFESEEPFMKKARPMKPQHVAGRRVTPVAGRRVTPVGRRVKPVAGRRVILVGRTVTRVAGRRVTPVAGRRVIPVAGRRVISLACRRVTLVACRRVTLVGGRRGTPVAERTVIPVAVRSLGVAGKIVTHLATTPALKYDSFSS